jgi:hypothetical protein
VARSYGATAYSVAPGSVERTADSANKNSLPPTNLPAARNRDPYWRPDCRHV